MLVYEVIKNKRDGRALSQGAIDHMISGYVAGTLPDYQMSALLMAIFYRGMETEELAAWTRAMVHSGEVIEFAGEGPYIDKHSTGGVGDKTTLVVAPLVAAAGLPVAKMSGRGLGFSGGTLDKLESIPGFSVSLSLERFFECVRECGVVVAGQTAQLVPADGKLYALRDVTATVPSLPLIASSIMSKKIAGGADAIALDVKVGRGAFMETLPDARALAELMIHIGRGVGRQVTALLSDMSQPLGCAVGNALEVREAIQALWGGGPPDLAAHCLQVGAEMLLLAGEASSPAEALQRLEGVLESGAALATFRTWVATQGGDPTVVDDLSLLPQAPIVLGVPAPRSGYLSAIDAREVGLVTVGLGAGRERKGEAIDLAVGVVLGAKVGAHVEAGSTLYTIHARSEAKALAAQARLSAAYAWSGGPIEAPPLFYDILRPWRSADPVSDK